MSLKHARLLSGACVPQHHAARFAGEGDVSAIGGEGDGMNAAVAYRRGEATAARVGCPHLEMANGGAESEGASVGRKGDAVERRVLAFESLMKELAAARQAPEAQAAVAAAGDRVSAVL